MEAALFLIFCFLLSFILLAAAVRSQRRSNALPPGPPGWPIIGNIFQIGKAPHRSLANLSRIYGSVMSLRFGSLTTVIISSPEAAREVLKTHDQVLSGRIILDPIRSIDHHDVSMAWLPSTSPRWRRWMLHHVHHTDSVASRALHQVIMDVTSDRGLRLMSP
ncbi:hypothetical protein DY000_02032053 [Brassica cretica]|uniref:Uncharacterized protein n=1 Tax=Brassica cretica TaxID=69181 RepID=A0ABQ7DY59_BRACR|nr:hypothetical protein DY000_02032053 [Brassica cretica]